MHRPVQHGPTGQAGPPWRRQAPIAVDNSAAVVDWLVGISVALGAVFMSAYWLTALGWGFAAYIFARFIREVGTDIPIDTMMCCIAALQWFVAPALNYRGFAEHCKYRQYVPEEQYMALVVPGMILLAIGLSLFRTPAAAFKRTSAIQRLGVASRHADPRGPLFLLALGLLAALIRHSVPGPLRFPMYVLSNVTYVAVIYGMIMQPRFLWRWVALGATIAFLTSLERAIFHDMLLWLVMIGIFAAALIRPKLTTKMAALAGMILTLVVVQGVKHEFRQSVWRSDFEGSRVALFLRIAGGEDIAQTGTAEPGETVWDNLLIRFNQGWIISRIMDRVPDFEPSANGKTVKDAVVAALVPRVLAPNKAKAGGHANYERYTGFKLSGTSMCVTLPGEGYINFGVGGAWAFLFAIGAVWSLALRLTFDRSLRAPVAVIWIPLIFLHAIKAESELVVVLNYLVKTAIIVAALFAAHAYYRMGQRQRAPLR